MDRPFAMNMTTVQRSSAPKVLLSTRAQIDKLDAGLTGIPGKLSRLVCGTIPLLWGHVHSEHAILDERRHCPIMLVQYRQQTHNCCAKCIVSLLLSPMVIILTDLIHL